MKLISWNVNGLRACLTHDFAASFAALDADIFSVQETKMQPGQAEFAPEGYTEYTYSAEKKGYSGTACWCKTAPLAVTTGIGREEHDHEGRVLTLEYPGFYLVNCYTPNSQDGLKRLDYRMPGEDAFRAYLLALDAAGRLLTCTCLSEGSVNSANVPMRKLMRAALSANASGVVLAHNHPAGIALPSHEDVELTRRLQQALDVVDILLLDHLVIADDDFVSLRDSGYLR